MNHRKITIYVLIFLIGIALFQGGIPLGEPPEEIGYREFLNLIEQEQVGASVTIQERRIQGTFAGEEEREFITLVPTEEKLNEVVDSLVAQQVDINVTEPEGPSIILQMLTWVLPFILLMAIFFFFMQQSQGGGSRVMNFGKSKAKLHDSSDKDVTFKDVAGVEEAKEDLEEVVQFLKEPKKFNDLGARIPKGVLLFGPPGTGKTLLAKAVAGEAGVPFFSISGSDFVEMFVGVGASRVRDLFENAKKNSPCIIFIDEIDAVGRQRGAGLGGGHDEREQTLNQLLVEMDGFGPNEGIIVMAATNRPDILDNALLRPGRFDRQVTVDSPDVKGREQILKVHSAGKPLDESVKLEVLARRTPGFTGADLENLVNEGALLAARRDSKEISMDDLENAIDRVIAGPEKKSRVMNETERKILAYHEAGHAVVSHFLEHADPVHKVTIVPRGRAGGYTLSLPKEDRFLLTRSEIMAKISVLLGGRVAEDLVLGEISTGAQNDIERVSSLTRKLIMEYGMSDKLGPLTFGQKQDQVFLGRDISRDRDYSEEVASAIDKETKDIVNSGYQRAVEILTEKRDRLDALSDALLEQETINVDAFNALMDGNEVKSESRIDESEDSKDKTEDSKDKSEDSKDSQNN
ncbi:ATP-dependent zinc metalloprotease FtsH [Proteinivorax tanatarense]|uniref:ATP-dependent zinc metalloprotease FtsH n=1 Tax=Proteinivorax tanatarense TaxID=1260629 RepID=A0AAU7VM61_9FIRM